MARRLTPQERFKKLHRITYFQRREGLERAYGQNQPSSKAPAHPGRRQATANEISRHLKQVRRPNDRFAQLHDDTYDATDADIATKEEGQLELEEKIDRQKRARKGKGLR